jgi:hypothetical protein
MLRKITRMLIHQLRAIIDTGTLTYGVLRYMLTGRTPPTAYQALIRLFCWSRGRSNDCMAALLALGGAPLLLPAASEAHGIVELAATRRIAAKIRADGYCVLDSRIAPDVCERLLAFALTTNARLRGATDSVAAREGRAYRRDRPEAVRYDIESANVLSCAEVQRLLADPALLAIAAHYLGTTPIADVVTMWWHTAYSTGPDEDAGQFFHFDMDRIKWLKFFIYLTDVGPENGPHCFIKGSHKTKGIPAALLRRGYVRLSDEDVFSHYPKDQMTMFTAPRGTIIAEDTRGLHKGLEVLEGDRLVLQLQFSASLFGSSYPPVTFGRVVSAELGRMLAAQPRIYSNYWH